MFDIAVMGGGLAGSALAIMLCKANFNVVILDKGDSPNFHLPETALLDDTTILSMLGLSSEELASVLDTEMRTSFCNSDHSQEITIAHRFKSSQKGLTRVNRIGLDHLLLRKAVKAGAIYKSGADIQFVNIGNDSSSLVYKELGECKTLTAKYIIDATGKAALLANLLELKEAEQVLSGRQLIFTHFENAEFRKQLDDKTIYITDIQQGHVFVIPLSAARFSIGAVIQHPALIKPKQYEAVFNEALNEVSWIQKTMPDMSRKLPYIKAQNESFICKHFSTKNYLIAGEATGFRDPFYSNGIITTLAMITPAFNTVVKLLNASNETHTICQDYNSEINNIITDLEKQPAQWLQNHSLKVKSHSQRDPHIPYGITHFLTAVS